MSELAQARQMARRRVRVSLRSRRPAVIGVQSCLSWPCGQNSQPKPECHRRRAICATRREGGGLLILSAGPGAVVLPLIRQSDGRPRRMVLTRQSLAARRQGEVNRGRNARRVMRAVDALRRRKARRPDSSRTDARRPAASRSYHLRLTPGATSVKRSDSRTSPSQRIPRGKEPGQVVQRGC